MVDDSESSVRFYFTLFGAAPAVLKTGSAKWMLDDPRVNFAITSGASSRGLDHLGLQFESDDDSGADCWTSGGRRAVGHDTGERRVLLCVEERAERHCLTTRSDGGIWSSHITSGRRRI